ncbi:MAG: hypothetical protein QHI38_09875 [Armatimonadota bacterium]|nr:hypothetical protein [Armatimonadota bacterium]
MRLIAAMIILAMVPLGAFGGRSITVDPAYPYYKDRSVESVVEEIKANGYDEVRLCCVNESGIDGKLVKAFADAGVRVWMLTFTNGVYSRVDLPKGWEAWRMKLRKKPDPAGFTMLCPNNRDYRAWKKQQVTAALQKYPFYGIDLAEPQMPAYPGPESEYYGCFCDACLAEFKRLYPDAPCFPDFDDPKSPHYWKTDKELYEKWVGFRVASVVNWLDDLVNGEGGIREKCPGVKVATWSLGLDVPDQLAKLREWQALDAAAIVRRVKPDVHVIQTDWPDWIKDNLKPDYPSAYKPVFDSVRQAAPSIPILLQTDIGSKPNMRRDNQWIKAVEAEAKKLGYAGVFHYEYHLGDYIYSEPPAVLASSFQSDTIKLVFNKRLDPAQACNVSNYSLSSGRVDFARVDGNIVYLSVSGVGRGSVLTISGLSDDPSRRLYHDKPACVMPEPVEIALE